MTAEPVLIIYGSDASIRVNGLWTVDGVQFDVPADFSMMTFDRLEVALPLHTPTRYLYPGDRLTITASNLAPLYR